MGVLKKEKLSLEVNHTKLLEKLETLDKDHKSLESKFAILSKSSGQPQGETSKEKEVEVFNPCCDHVEEIASLKKHKLKHLEINTLQEDALTEYFRLSKEKVPCCDHEEEIAALEKHKSMLLEINTLQENALKEHVQLNKEKEVEVFDITNPFTEHEDEVNRLKDKFEGL